MELPPFISVDDHVPEPLECWRPRLPSAMRGEELFARGDLRALHDTVRITEGAPGSRWTDGWWIRDNLRLGADRRSTVRPGRAISILAAL